MTNNFDTTLISLVTLTIFIISFFLWLVFRTLKEGRNALKEINRDFENMDVNLTRKKNTYKIIKNNFNNPLTLSPLEIKSDGFAEALESP